MSGTAKQKMRLRPTISWLAWLTFIPMSEAIIAILVSDSVHTLYTAALGYWKTVFVFAKDKRVRQRQKGGTIFCIIRLQYSAFTLT